MRENNQILIIFGIIVVINLLFIWLIASVLFFYQKKHNAFVTQLENVKIKFEKEILKSKLEVQEQTLQHISRELHDNIGQFLTLAKLNLNTIENLSGSTNGKKIDYVVDLLTKALEDVRDLSKSLSLDLINSAGLTRAIESQVEQLKKSMTYDIRFEVFGNYIYLEDQKEIILFRILQEALNNIIKHAEAKSIEIVLDCTDHMMILSIRDDGQGFLKEKYIREGKIHNHSGGLGNMIARSALINADFQIQSKPGKGTSISISVPLNS